MRIRKELYHHALMQEVRTLLPKLAPQTAQYLLPVKKRNKEQQALANNIQIVVALSGGADSVALLRALLLLGVPCCAAHCNFHLRGHESDADERFVYELCEQLNVPLFVKQCPTKSYAAENKCSIEEAARELRYQFFADVAAQTGATYVGTAHHLEDNIETLLFHLAQGCGVPGLRGIPPRRMPFIRPLINTSKQTILNFLELLQQPFCTDSTNSDTAITRNYIRHEIKPLFRKLNPSFNNACVRTFTTLREAEQLIALATSMLLNEAKYPTQTSPKKKLKAAAPSPQAEASQAPASTDTPRRAEAAQGSTDTPPEVEASQAPASADTLWQIEAESNEKVIYDAQFIANSVAPLTLMHALLAPLGFSRIRIESFTQTLTGSEPATIQSHTHQVTRRGAKLIIEPLPTPQN